MPLGDFLRRRSAAAKICGACGALAHDPAVFCSQCGVRLDDPDSLAYHIVDRSTGLFNDKWVRPVLEDELGRALRYERALGVLLIESRENTVAAASTPADEALRVMASAVVGSVRDVDTIGVLSKSPPHLLALLPETDMGGTAHAAHRISGIVNQALGPIGRRAAIGLVCVLPGPPRNRAGAVIEAAIKSVRSGQPVLLGR